MITIQFTKARHTVVWVTLVPVRATGDVLVLLGLEMEFSCSQEWRLKNPDSQIVVKGQSPPPPCTPCGILLMISRSFQPLQMRSQFGLTGNVKPKVPTSNLRTSWSDQPSSPPYLLSTFVWSCNSWEFGYLQVIEFIERDSIYVNSNCQRWNNQMALAEETDLFLRGSIPG